MSKAIVKPSLEQFSFPRLTLARALDQLDINSICRRTTTPMLDKAMMPLPCSAARKSRFKVGILSLRWHNPFTEVFVTDIALLAAVFGRQDTARNRLIRRCFEPVNTWKIPGDPPNSVRLRPALRDELDEVFSRLDHEVGVRLETIWQTETRPDICLPCKRSAISGVRQSWSAHDKRIRIALHRYVANDKLCYERVDTGAFVHPIQQLTEADIQRQFTGCFTYYVPNDSPLLLRKVLLEINKTPTDILIPFPNYIVSDIDLDYADILTRI